jgi:hypothetical protein
MNDSKKPITGAKDLNPFDKRIILRVPNVTSVILAIIIKIGKMMNGNKISSNILFS